MTTQDFTTAIEFLAAHCAKVWAGRLTILFSYSTRVGLWIRGEGEIRGYALPERISNTTAKHLRQFGPAAAEKVSAAEPDRLISGE